MAPARIEIESTKSVKESKFNPNFTQHVINTMGPKTDPRLRSVMASMITHLHDFARETECTFDEWSAGIELLNWAGRISSNGRNESLLLFDLLGIETIVDEIMNSKIAASPGVPTDSAVLGPYYRENAPLYKNGDSIVQGKTDGEVTYMHGRVLDAGTGKPIEGVVLDLWQASTNGKYEHIDETQPDFNLRGRFTSDSKGEYGLYCIRPTPYAIPSDGPGGTLLQLLDRHPMRPAHIHLLISHPGYKPLVTQIYDREDPYLETDTTFAVKDSLVVEFAPKKGDPKAVLDLAFDIRLVKPAEESQLAKTNGTALASSA